MNPEQPFNTVEITFKKDVINQLLLERGFEETVRIVAGDMLNKAWVEKVIKQII